MPSNEPPKVYSFVSGKGGVGKTSIAVNYGWVSAQSRKTVLVDLDLQNQGLTGLLSSAATVSSIGAFEFLASAASFEISPNLIEVSKNLLFLPAAGQQTILSPPLLASLLLTSSAVGRVKKLINNLKAATDCEVIILDCHGGLDYVSAGSYQASDRTIIVTEADTVTFNGTLELLDFYGSALQPLSTDPVTEEARHAFPLAQVVLNRIAPKYKYQDLKRVYEQLLIRLRDDYPLADSILAYLPQEDFISSHFGEYPFCAELAPLSVFSKKLWLMDYTLSDGRVVAQHCPVAGKIASAKYREKVRRIVISNEALNTQRMLSSFGLMSVVVLAYFALLPFIALSAGFQYDYQSMVSRHPALTAFLISLATAFVAVVFWFLTLAMWGAQRYYGEKFGFKKRLVKATRSAAKLSDRAILAQLQLIRITTFVPLCFCFCISLESIGFGGYMAFAAATGQKLW